jgi:predicted nuclease of predicted toxin-antitoxin system
LKFLLDENLSPELVGLLSEIYPDMRHVRDAGLSSAPDTEVWVYASQMDLAIVTKDADFHHRSFLFGSPPKVIWIRVGNCSTRQIAALLTDRREEIEVFLRSTASFLVLA